MPPRSVQQPINVSSVTSYAEIQILIYLNYGLRWLAVLPGAVIEGFLLTFPLSWMLYNTLSNFMQPYPALRCLDSHSRATLPLLQYR
jgi:hypothetical protein